MKNENEEGLAKSPFDLYFDSVEEEFIIKLYHVPYVPGRKTSKEWLEDFENEKPTEEYIASMYGSGNFWVMGLDKNGKIRSKNMPISDLAVQRILKAKKLTAPMALAPVNNMAGYGTGNNSPEQNINTFVGVLEKLMTGVVAPLITAQSKPASPVDQLEQYSEKMINMFTRNMEMINTKLMTFSKRIADEHLKEPEKKEEADQPGWVGELISGVKPYVDSFLKAQHAKAEIYKAQMQENPVFKSVLDDDEKLNFFFNGLADDPDIGEEKAVELFKKFGFSPIYDQHPENSTNTINNEPTKS